jgi:hypothetical protein
MTTLRSSDWSYRPAHAVRSAHTPLAILAAATALPIPFLMWLVPAPLVLPAFAVIALAAAAIAALCAWASGAERDADHITLWDAAGAFAFIGCGAAVLTGSEHVIYLFGHPLAG